MIHSTPSRPRRAGALLVLSLACIPVPAQIAAPGPDTPAPNSAATDASQAAHRAAPVVVRHHLVTVMRSELLGYPPAVRAEGAVQRIDAILDKDGPGEVTVQNQPQGRGFMIDGEFAFFLTPGDVNVIMGESLETATRNARAVLEIIMRERAEQRDPKAIAIAASLALGATIIFAGLLRLIITTNRWLRQRGSAALLARARSVKIAGVSAIEISQFLRGLRYLVTVLSWVLGLLVTYVWLVFVFERFPYTRSWGDDLLEWLVGSALHFVNAIAGAVPGLLTVVVIFLLARAVARLSATFFFRVETGRVSVTWLDADTARPTRRIVSVVIWLFALAMAYPYLPGAQTEAFRGLSVLVGLMITIGASNLVGQAASGLILMYARSYRAGEFVRIGETEGIVTDLGLFSTRIRSAIGEEVMLPNSLVLSQSAKNFSRATPLAGYLVDTTVTIGYAIPWRQVHAMLREAAIRTRGVLTEPEPRVFQTSLSDFYVEYRMVCHVDPEAAPLRGEALGQLHAHIQDVFNEHGVQIMSPHYMNDPPNAQIVPPAKWYAAPAKPSADEGQSG